MQKRKTITPDQARQRELLRIIEVADLLGESRANIYLRIKVGQIPAVRFGKTTRVRAVALFEMLDGLAAGTKVA